MIKYITDNIVDADIIKDTHDGTIADITQCKFIVKREIVKLTEGMHGDKTVSSITISQN